MVQLNTGLGCWKGLGLLKAIVQKTTSEKILIAKYFVNSPPS